LFFDFFIFHFLFKDGSFSFESKANFKYVKADNYGSSPLIASASKASLWEAFYIDNYTPAPLPFGSIKQPT